MKKGNKLTRFKNKLTDHYRFLVEDSDTHEYVFSFKLNILNSLLLLAFFTLFIISVTAVVLKYTPIKSYFVSEETISEARYKNQLLELNERLANIEDSLQSNDLYIKAVQAVVSGRIKAEKVDSLMEKEEKIALTSKFLKPTEEDSICRIQIAKEEIEAINKAKKRSNEPLYFVPVKGFVSSKYNIIENHLAIDIAAKMGESIKSIADGDVLLAEWIPKTGYTVIVKHPNDVISIYKHCSKVFVKTGKTVEKGEVIAEVGNSGELTNGPHLHFELWIHGKAVDPEEYINF